jgi:hypothetical protein
MITHFRRSHTSEQATSKHTSMELVCCSAGLKFVAIADFLFTHLIIIIKITIITIIIIINNNNNSNRDKL